MRDLSSKRYEIPFTVVYMLCCAAFGLWSALESYGKVYPGNLNAAVAMFMIGFGYAVFYIALLLTLYCSLMLCAMVFRSWLRERLYR